MLIFSSCKCCCCQITVTGADIKASGDDDCLEYAVAKENRPAVCGRHATTLRTVEEETATYILMAFDGKDDERLLIFSGDAKHRFRAEKLLSEAIRDFSRYGSNNNSSCKDQRNAQ